MYAGDDSNIIRWFSILGPQYCGGAFTNISYPQAFAMHSSVSGIEPELIPVFFFPKRPQIPSQLFFPGIVARIIEFCTGQGFRQELDVRKVALIGVGVAVVRTIAQVSRRSCRRTPARRGDGH